MTSAGPDRHLVHARRAALLDAAARLFLDRDFEGADVQSIARTAVVGKATVYQHFAGNNTNTHHSASSSPGRYDGYLATRFPDHLRSNPGKPGRVRKGQARYLSFGTARLGSGDLHAQRDPTAEGARSRRSRSARENEEHNGACT
ncbi:TetR family transcriptional regulator [Nannocystis radixulma]|uniref:TetR family transcriptional regulator n=1 Tax=Nannocystis radixulma TaxID=2995305 RepID=A0ABT5BCX6_9BACT|nr:TetR family transcriptional regulator [Nannocystis radixulma]MDC0671990.1 TetR family transcriptional regulator [Nannocystis radixulma]